MDPQDLGAGEKPGRPLDRYKNTDTASQKVASPQREWLRHRWTPILCALGAPGDGRSLPLLRPYASLLPHHFSKGGAAPQAALRPTSPLLTCCALASWRPRGGCGCSASSTPQPAGSWLPLLGLGRAPDVFLGQPNSGLPSPRCLRTLSKEGGRRAPRLTAPRWSSRRG